ncbi:B3 DNA binding domain [Macleaya cordata]|nr:B3 DNA binding domain [Macleaya cordata]
MKHISEEESDRAILKGPSGSQWHVKLCKTEDGTYLQDGWQDFVRDHSLCYYEFLVFRYDGNMCFNVQIFDKSGCEREDACSSKTQGLIFPIEKKFVSYAGKKRGKPPKRCAGSADLFPSRDCYTGKKRGRQPKKFAGSADLFPFRACQRDSGIEAVAEKRIKTEDVSMPTSERDSQARGCLSRRKLKTEEEKAKVWKATESFSSSCPYFAKCLNCYNVRTRFVLNIPKGFCTAHLPRFSTKIILRNPRGKDWFVNLKYTGGKYSFVGGWTAFVRGNKLEEGDICIFELVGKCEFCVHIFPVGPL